MLKKLLTSLFKINAERARRNTVAAIEQANAELKYLHQHREALFGQLSAMRKDEVGSESFAGWGNAKIRDLITEGKLAPTGLPFRKGSDVNFHFVTGSRDALKVDLGNRRFATFPFVSSDRAALQRSLTDWKASEKYAVGQKVVMADGHGFMALDVDAPVSEDSGVPWTFPEALSSRKHEALKAEFLGKQQKYLDQSRAQGREPSRFSDASLWDTAEVFAASSDFPGLSRVQLFQAMAYARDNAK